MSMRWKPKHWPESQEEELTITGFKHGASAYRNHGCRGPICRDAHSAEARAAAAKRHKRTREEGVPGTVEHGASAYRNWGCRCIFCISEHADSQHKYR